MGAFGTEEAEHNENRVGVVSLVAQTGEECYTPAGGKTLHLMTLGFVDDSDGMGTPVVEEEDAHAGHDHGRRRLEEEEEAEPGKDELAAMMLSYLLSASGASSDIKTAFVPGCWAHFSAISGSSQQLDCHDLDSTPLKCAEPTATTAAGASAEAWGHAMGAVLLTTLVSLCGLVFLVLNPKKRNMYLVDLVGFAAGTLLAAVTNPPPPSPSNPTTRFHPPALQHVQPTHPPNINSGLCRPLPRDG